MNKKNYELEEQLKVLMNHFNSGNYKFVISKVKKIIKKFPEYLVLYNVLGSSYQQIGEYPSAKNNFLKALKMDSKNITAMNNLANTHKRLEEFDEAENLFLKIINLDSKYIYAFINYGNLKRDMNDFVSAIDLYKKALKINDKLPVVHFALSLAFQGLGNFKLAIEHADKTLSLEPKFTQADKIISQSKKYKNDDEHFNQMKKKNDNLNLNNQQKINLCFALAKAYEDVDDLENCFKKLKEGNKLKKDSLKYDLKQEILLFEKIKNVFSKININQINQNFASKKNIIFILGMPRSGTTIVEQIISSHSNVYGAGELPYLTKIIREELFDENNLSSKKFKNVMIDNPLKQKEMIEKYFNYLNRFNSSEKFITDKAPLNFRWIGFIKILFPNAKVIHCSRNPKDNCLSLYKNIFEGGLNFSYDQKDLGTFYNLYSDLVSFWNTKLPDFIFEAKYEKIINNQEVESKKIIKFCGLEWEPQCLMFHKNKNPIKTMSTAQARRPLYKTSLNSYEKFSPYLGTLNKLIS